MALVWNIILQTTFQYEKLCTMHINSILVKNERFILLSCLWHQTTKQRILFYPIFSTNFFQLEQLKKKTNFLLVQNSCFLNFGPMRSSFSFSSPQTEKISRKILGKTNEISVFIKIRENLTFKFLETNWTKIK